eukprot:MONOS_6774.1-p1 / transcript=MONOS_6774.1 / gene=MONOS_6774 / organism=Monocercomonoides_exilis_PA203 / gene_product=alpha / transcript_product=alpha / location=Mono_scaffold00219:83985-86492(-) / protein_length=735 / sequence_SO=supercontig / SO=protein_coding / is_pseudo=false
MLHGEAQEFSVDVNIYMKKVGNLQASHDGSKIAFVARKLDENTHKKHAVLYVQKVNDANPTAVMENEAFSVTEFSWGPDGDSIAFLQSEDPKSIYLYTISNSKFEKKASFPLPIGNIRWSNKGGIIVFSASVYPGMTMQQTVDYQTQRDAYGSDAIVFDNSPLYSWDHFIKGDYNHLFYITVNTNEMTFGDEATDIMNKFEGECPEESFGSYSDFDISANDDMIVYSTQPEAVEPWSVRKHVYAYSITAKNQVKTDATCLTCGRTGMHTNPTFSPTGRYVAMLETTDDYAESEYAKVLLFDLFTKETKKFLEKWDEMPNGIHWSSHLPGTILVTASSRGRGRVFSLDIATGKIDASNDAFSVSSCQMIDKKRMVYLKSSFTHPTDVFIGNLVKGEDGLKETQLTNMNKEVLESLATPLIEPVEEFYEGALKEKGKVQGWYFPPKGRKEGDGKKYPLLVWIHGGPEGSWDSSWSDRWNPECFLMQTDHAMFLPNIRGSTGFGEEFTKQIRGNWATHALTDVIEGRKYILQKYNYLEPKKTAAMGGSFGGYMVNLLQSQDSTQDKEKSKNPFAALVCHDGVYDLPQLAYEGDSFFMLPCEFGKTVWEDRAVYEKHSPSHGPGAGKWSTPQLTFHGLKDYRCAKGQGIGVFTVLQRVGCPSRLVLFPEENHWVVNPYNSVEWHKEALEWLKKYLSNKEVEATWERNAKMAEKTSSVTENSNDTSEVAKDADLPIMDEL